MSRTFEYVRGDAADAATTVVLTCPADHKYEVQLVALTQNSNAVNKYRILFKGSGIASKDIEVVTTTAAEYARAFRYESIVLRPGDELHVNCTDTVGAVGYSYYVSYVDVDFS